MIDIIKVDTDVRFFDTQTERAKNILSVQVGDLQYAPDLGIDLRYFLREDLRFQNESFKAYLIQILANYSINVAAVTDIVNSLHREYVFNITPAETDTGMVAR